MSDSVAVNACRLVRYLTTYPPYGEELEAGPFGSPFKFTGEMMDDNDLVYLRTRYYHPGLGMFPSLDPVENGNRYQYVSGNPINAIDPSGMLGENPGMAGDKCFQKNDPCGDGCCGPDATLWIQEEINRHILYAETSVRENLPSYPDPKPNPFAPETSSWLWTFQTQRVYAERATVFALYGLAVDYGYVDYRWLAEISSSGQSAGFNYSCSQSSREQTITVCGRCVNSTDFGNFILGAVIYAGGETRELATLSGVGSNIISGDWANVFGQDTAAVEAGYDYARDSHNAAFDSTSFCSALYANIGWLETPKGTPRSGCTDCPCEDANLPNLDNAGHSTPGVNLFVSSSIPGNFMSSSIPPKAYACPKDELVNRLGVELEVDCSQNEFYNSLTE